MWLATALLCGLVACLGGCATIRTTDPARTATEEYLMSVAVERAVEQISAHALRDRKVFVDTTYIGAVQTSAQHSFLIAETRASLLIAGVRLVPQREQAEIILEMRSGGLSVDRLEYLLGIPAITVPAVDVSGVPLLTPELAFVKNTKQLGFAGVAYVAYWQDSGEIVARSGPFVGRTLRDDWWFFGFGPRTIGDIPPAQR
jgi:hypothetical protein